VKEGKVGSEPKALLKVLGNPTYRSSGSDWKPDRCPANLQVRTGTVADQALTPAGFLNAFRSNNNGGFTLTF
jgi:hypothetical protein